MEFDFDTLKEQGIDLANKVKDTAMDLANKGRLQAQLLDQQAKLAKAQRQLGALVYSLTKSGEENAPLVEKYVESIDEIEQAMTAIRDAMNSGAPAAPADKPEEDSVVINIDDEPSMDADTDAAAPAEPAQAPESKACPQCGQPVSEGELFCNHCGAQL